MIVQTPSPSAIVQFTGALRFTVNVSDGHSPKRSPLTVTEIVPLGCPAGMLSVPPDIAV